MVIKVFIFCSLGTIVSILMKYVMTDHRYYHVAKHSSYENVHPCFIHSLKYEPANRYNVINLVSGGGAGVGDGEVYARILGKFEYLGCSLNLYQISILTQKEVQMISQHMFNGDGS